MDRIEKIASRESIEQSVRSGDFLLEKKKRLQKLQRSPYFGRFDVAHGDGDEAQELIIQGVAGSGKSSIRAGRRRAYGGMFAGASCAARWRQKGQ